MFHSTGIDPLSVKLYQRFFMGKFRRAVIGHSIDPELRVHSASGGLVSGLLADRLERKQVDGALIAGLQFPGEVCPEPCTVLATSSKEVAACSGSVYSDFDHVDGVCSFLENTPGVYDIVALPCQITLLRKHFQRKPELAERTGLMLGLWCGHTSNLDLLRTVFSKWGIDPASVHSFKYRTGHWRGSSQIVLKNGDEHYKSFRKGYGLYQNMYADTPLRCFSCPDHFGEGSDLSFGDCWLRSARKSSVKKTMAVSFTPEGDEVLMRVLSSDKFAADEIDPLLAVASQKRSIVWHTFSREARYRMSKVFSISISGCRDLSPRCNDYISAFLTLLYHRSFNSRFRSLLFRVPWWLLFPMMAFQKLMLNR